MLPLDFEEYLLATNTSKPTISILFWRHKKQSMTALFYAIVNAVLFTLTEGVL
jgi:hypothetical protein